MKTKTNKKFEGLTIWVNNMIAGEVFITTQFLERNFQTWLKTKDAAWLNYYWFEAAARAFLTDPAPGMSGTFDEKDFRGVYDFLKPIAESYLQGIERIEVLRRKNDLSGLSFDELVEFQKLKARFEKSV